MTAESVQASGASERGPVFRFFFGHQIDTYPKTAGRRTAYLAVAVIATIVLYYTYYTQTGVTPTILRTYHMSFSFYVWIVIISNLLGAFASLPASKTDQLGRANTIIYGLLIIGLLIAVGVPNCHTEWSFAIVISAIGLVEGAILVATPAMVRDYSPQLGRASAMGFWTVGPVAGSLITSIVANRTLSHFIDWQSQFIISGIVSIVVFVLALLFMKDLSPRLRDQLMVTAHDRSLVEARARGLSDQEVESATANPWSQIAKWDLVGLSFGIAVFLLIYYVAAAFFTIYYTVVFQNPNGTPLTTSQVNGLNEWFWGADIIALIVVGAVSDRLRVRKPFMAIGVVGGIITLLVFRSFATHPHTGFDTLIGVGILEAFFLSMVYTPWMAGYTETVEAKNPALVGTGLALWGWILRVVVGVSFIFLPLVITSVNPVVDNLGVATHKIGGVSIADFVATHPKVITFATKHAALLTKIKPYTATLEIVTKDPSTSAALGRVEKDLGPTLSKVLAVRATLKKLVVPYQAQLNYISANKSHLKALQNGVKEAPGQWQRWFLVDMVGMIVFIPAIWLTRGRWSPARARRDAEEHDKAVADELAALLKEEGAASTA